MGKLSVSLFAVLAACGSDAAKQTDAASQAVDAPKAVDAKVFQDAPAPVYDFSCLNNTIGTADANITIGGTVTEISLNGITPVVGPLAGAAMVGCNGAAANCNGANQYGTDTSKADGTFSIGPVATNGSAIDATVSMTFQGDRPAIVFAAGPLTKSQTAVPVLTFTNAAFGAINTAAKLGQMDANGTLALYVTDCADKPIADSTNIMLSVTQGGAAVADTKTFDAGALSAMAAGLFLVSNVKPGDTDVGVMYKGMTFRSHTIKSVAGTDSETVIRPGY